MFKRILIMDLPDNQSAFLWGARQTGKSSFLKSHFPNAIYYDLLDPAELLRLSKNPELFHQELQALPDRDKALPIIVDEIQKIPALLNGVHLLIENEKMQFILCGSSARRLKTESTNLLGGRAWPFYFFPLTYAEIPKFDLLRALSHGLIPTHYLAQPKDIANHLRSYVNVYLTEEIRNEGLVRNLPGFARFLDIAGLCNAEMINWSNIARDCGINRVTVQEYYQILIDTLLGHYIYPFRKKIKRDLILATPKFYLFDVGVANYLARQTVTDLKGAAAGKAFEQYILLELIAYRELKRKRFDVTYWRTKTGLEVDFILGNAEIAIEVKISGQVHQEDLKGLMAFCEEHPQAKAIVVSQDKNPRLLEVKGHLKIHILPWEHFLQELWQGQII